MAMANLSTVLLLLTIGCIVQADNVQEKIAELERKVDLLTRSLLERTERSVPYGLPSQMVAFSAALTHIITPVASNEIIIFDHVHVNLGNAYDPFVGGFKATMKGVYHFATTIMSYSGNYMEIEMVYTTSSSTTPRVLCRARASQSYNAMGVCIANVRLDIGDDVWVRHYGTSGTYIKGDYYPTFSGHLIYNET